MNTPPYFTLYCLASSFTWICLCPLLPSLAFPPPLPFTPVLQPPFTCHVRSYFAFSCLTLPSFLPHSRGPFFPSFRLPSASSPCYPVLTPYSSTCPVLLCLAQSYLTLPFLTFFTVFMDPSSALPSFFSPLYHTCRQATLFHLP